jgi:putative holliday junction resolvase
MGIDLGESRVGVAISDPELMLAHPAGNIEVRGDYFQALDEVIDLAEQYNVNRIIVGNPLLLDGTEGHSAKKAKRWTHNLKRRIEQLASRRQLRLVDIPVIDMKDERLTTVTAHKQLLEAGIDNRQHKPKVDQQSAVILLQTSLNELLELQGGKVG